MPIEKTELERLVKQAFPDAAITLTDLAGDNDHWALDIASPSFKGKSRIEQHKMVNSALNNMVGGTLHALQLKTSIPE